MLSRWARFALRRKPDYKVYVRLLFEDGPPTLLGPMDPLSAEIFIIHRLSPHPFYNGRKVASARIIGDND